MLECCDLIGCDALAFTLIAAPSVAETKYEHIGIVVDMLQCHSSYLINRSVRLSQHQLLYALLVTEICHGREMFVEEYGSYAAVAGRFGFKH